MVLALVGPSTLGSQETGAALPAYSAAQLHCARFAETSRSEIETETARGAVDATAGREGVWTFRAADSAGAIVLEGWYDTLSVHRRTADTEYSADTDGLIGGRYRGLLRPSGAYVPVARPFVPDEVAEVADLSGAAEDLFPPLPPRPLAAGESWKDEWITISRQQDTVVAGQRLLRFRLEARREAREIVPRGDTVPIPLRQTTVEEGGYLWNPASGLVRRTRDITVEASIPSGGRIRQPVRSRVVQHIELIRMSSQPACK
jgi:hypothetical protein